jgi:phenylpyruvate tautomerase PptA (4-oxalocrotonate tautomerase family)
MAQVKIYGLRKHLQPLRKELSDVIHSCVVEALQFPRDKRAHRFFHMEPEDFFYPASTTERYTIIEISLMEGRTVETKKRLIRLLFERICSQLDRQNSEIEISIVDSARHNWGFRGMPGDEIGLNYRVEV